MMDNHLDSKFERLYESLGEIKAELIAIKIDLNFHIHRTNLLEQKFDSLDRDVTKLRGFFAIGGWIVATCATVLTVLKYIGVL